MGLKNLSLKEKVTMLSALFVTGMAVLGVVAFMALNEVKIGGQMYSEIHTYSSIDGHYAPLAGYLIAARLTVVQLDDDIVVKDQSQVRKHVETFEQARKAYEDAHDRYTTLLPDGKLKDL